MMYSESTEEDVVLGTCMPEHSMEGRRQQRTMRAWAIERHGAADVLHRMELPVPHPMAHEVLIHMQGAEVGPWDALVRQGRWPGQRLASQPFPLVLGLAGAGTVAAVGQDVTHLAPGHAVYACMLPQQGNGAWADYMLLPASQVARAPVTLNLTRAGAVPVAGLTAHETLTDILNVQPGDVVLIAGAAGGVGHLAVQIAAGLHARVLATACRRHHDFVRSLGAEAVIDPSQQNVADAVRTLHPRGVDKVLSTVRGPLADQVAQAVRPGGRLVDLSGAVSVVPDGVHVHGAYMVKPDADRLARLARMIDGRRLKVEIQEVFSFEWGPYALEVAEAGHVRGKLVLEIGGGQDRPL
jgi:NADPH2:quinone reductase